MDRVSLVLYGVGNFIADIKLTLTPSYFILPEIQFVKITSIKLCTG